MTDPHDISVEQALLGAVLVDNRAWWRVNTLEPEMFYDPVHAQIFAACKREIEGQRVASPLTLAPLFARHDPVADGVSVKAYLGRLAVNATTTTNAGAYAQVIRDLAMRRRLIATFSAGIENAQQPLSDIEKTASAAVTAMDEVLAAVRMGTRSTRQTFAEAGSDLMDAMLNDDGSTRISTGLASLDKATSGGWRRKQLAMIAGRPSMGKTSVAVASAMCTARKGVGVMLFSLEMSNSEVVARMASDLCWDDGPISYGQALSGRLDNDQNNRFAKAIITNGKMPFTIDEQAGLTLAQIKARTRQEAERMARANRRLGVVMVDHLGLLRASARYAGNRVAEIGEISSGLKELAKDMDVAVVALSQLNRGTEGRDNKRPGLSDLRDSGNLEQDADLVCFTYRESYYLERAKHDPGSTKELERQTLMDATKSSMEIIIAKNRNGPTTTIPLFCDMASNVVRDAATHDPYGGRS